MKSQLLAIYDRSGKLDLTKDSPGGGRMPVISRGGPSLPWRINPTDALEDIGTGTLQLGNAFQVQWETALVLRTESGEIDLIGRNRALEVLATSRGMNISSGLTFASEWPWWRLTGHYAKDVIRFSAYPDDTNIEALAKLLQPLGCEVIHGQ